MQRRASLAVFLRGNRIATSVPSEPPRNDSVRFISLDVIARNPEGVTWQSVLYRRYLYTFGLIFRMYTTATTASARS